MIIHCFDYGSYSSSVDLPRNTKHISHFKSNFKYIFYFTLFFTILYFYKYKRDTIQQYTLHMLMILVIIVFTVEILVNKFSNKFEDYQLIHLNLFGNMIKKHMMMLN